MTSKLISFFKCELWRRNKGVFLLFQGDTGSGKSLGAIGLAMEIQKDWPIENLVFEPEDFLHLLNTPGRLKRGDVVIWDECGCGLSARAFMSLQNRMMGFIAQTIRHRNLCIILTVPQGSFIDIQWRQLIHGVFEPMFINYDKQFCHCKFQFSKTNRTTGKIYRKYPRIKPPNGMRTKVTHIDFYKPPPHITNAYEPRAGSFKDGLGIEAEKAIRAIKQKTEVKYSKKHKARELKKKGYSAKKIAIELDVPVRNVFNWIK